MVLKVSEIWGFANLWTTVLRWKLEIEKEIFFNLIGFGLLLKTFNLVFCTFSLKKRLNMKKQRFYVKKVKF